MPKIVEIDNCYECPHYMQPWQCLKTNRTIEALLHTPSWCPLPDAPKKEEKK